jgi:hypothetical protein
MLPAPPPPYVAPRRSASPTSRPTGAPAPCATAAATRRACARAGATATRGATAAARRGTRAAARAAAAARPCRSRSPSPCATRRGSDAAPRPLRRGGARVPFVPFAAYAPLWRATPAGAPVDRVIRCGAVRPLFLYYRASFLLARGASCSLPACAPCLRPARVPCVRRTAAAAAAAAARLQRRCPGGRCPAPPGGALVLPPGTRIVRVASGSHGHPKVWIRGGCLNGGAVPPSRFPLVARAGPLLPALHGRAFWRDHTP